MYQFIDIYIIDYGINSILYQRGIYPTDNFSREKKYGMTLLVSCEPRLKKFLKPLMENVEGKSFLSHLLNVNNMHFREQLFNFFSQAKILNVFQVTF